MFRNTLLNKTAPARTENGMKAVASTNDAVLDLFYQIGAMRGKNVIPVFAQAYNTDPILATKVALWARDVRGGAGERKIFRDILGYLEKNDRSLTERVIAKIPEVGRFDDLLVFTEDYAKTRAFLEIGNALNQKNGLAAKWMPRQGEKAVELRNFFGMSPKTWRKALVRLSNTVEQQMCAKEWSGINFDHVPSVAAKRLQKAFKRNAGPQYENYIAGLKTGDRKINASAVYPYDVIDALNTGDARVALAQWEALPNYTDGEKWLPMVDVSGSMSTASVGNRLTALDVAVSLGLYFADKNEGAMKDVFLEFSSTARLHVLQGNLVAKYNALNRMKWEMSTNLHGAFNELLNHAIRNNILQRDMPTGIMILSDMQFNACARFDDSAMQMIRRKYEQAGYRMPKIVFWNLAARSDNAPAAFDERGVALVSGFSPAIFKAVAASKRFNPRDVMLEALSNERYDI